VTTTIDGSNESTFAAGVTCTALNGGQFAGNRNVIIGGNFTTNPWQRGTSFTNLANVQFSADRFQVAYVQDGVVDVIKTADSPTAAEAGTYSSHCLHLDVTTADSSLAANQRYFIRHHVEGLNTVGFGFGQAGARPITLSFWVKSTKTGIFCVALRNSAGDRFFISEYTVNSTDTWEKKTISITADTTGTWLATNGIGLRIEWVIALAGTSFTGSAGSWQAGDKSGTTNQVNGLDSASNNFKLALIQLEEGSVATPFEQKHAETELALCQRYYQKSYAQGVAPATVTNVGAYFDWVATPNTSRPYGFVYTFNGVMRTTPTTTIYSTHGSGASAKIYNWATEADVTAAASSSHRSYLLSFTSSTANQQISWHYTASSEL